MVDVVVIGGGVAGLSAATDLVARGYRVVVLEARSALGGRAMGGVDPATGERLGYGPHMLLGCYRETFRFLDRIGTLSAVDLDQSLRVTVIDRAGRRSDLRTPPAPPPWHFVGAVLEWNGLSFRERLEVLRLIGPIRIARREAEGASPVRAASPGETVVNWLVRHGQGPQIRALLWEPLARATLNQDPAVAAAPPFVRVLAAFVGGEVRDSAIGVPRLPLEALYAEPARRFIEAHGGQVRTNAPARLALDNGRLRGARVGEAIVEARAVIAAVPWFALADLFDHRPPAALQPIVEAAARLQPVPIVTVTLWFDRPVVDVPVVGLPGRVLPWAVDSHPRAEDEAACLSLVAGGATELAERGDEALVALALEELCDALPGARTARLLRAVVARDERGTFSLAPGAPPRPGPETPLPGFFLAGDWTDTGLPGTIESAAVSGHRAAERASRTLR